MISEYCIGCRHLDTDLVACVYILNMHRSRAFTMRQPSGNGCQCREECLQPNKMREAISKDVRAHVERTDAACSRNERRLKLYKAGCTDAELAARCGVSTSTAKRWRRLRGLPPNKKAAESSSPKRVLYDLGFTDRQMAKQLGVATGTITKWRSDHDLPPNVPPEEEQNDN